MRPASTLERSRMSLISESRWWPEAWMSRMYSACFGVKLAEQAVLQHFGEADDRVERRAQLVRHVGQELGLVLARGLQLAIRLSELARSSDSSRQQAHPARRGWEPRPRLENSPAAISAMRASICSHRADDRRRNAIAEQQRQTRRSPRQTT